VFRGGFPRGNVHRPGVSIGGDPASRDRYEKPRHLNRLGLALPSEEAQQKKRLRHYARVNARRLLNSDEAKGVAIRRFVVEGSPFVEIARTVRTEKVNVVIMGSYGGAKGVDKIFFGSTAEKVVRTAGCPVLTVPLTQLLPSQRTTAASRPKEMR
jgi:hypothetical protein